MQSDFPSYLSHSTLLINTIAIITRSGTFSIHYTSFISVTHTLHLNYYQVQSQYKFVIQFVQQYKNLYAKIKAYLRRNEAVLYQQSFPKGYRKQLSCKNQHQSSELLAQLMKKGHAHIGTFLGYIYMSEMMGHAVGDNTNI